MLALQSAIARMPNPSILVDHSGHIVFANRPAVDALGVEELGQPLFDLLPLAALPALLATVIATDQARHLEISLEGQRFFTADLIPVPGLGAAVCMHDITALKRLDTMKANLSTIISHDLRNPLGVAMGFAEILAEEPNLSSEARTCIDGIRSSLGRMHNLINQALDLVRADSDPDGDPSQSDVAVVIDQVVQDLGPLAAGRKQKLTATVAPELPMALIDPVSLTEALRHVVEHTLGCASEEHGVHISAEALEEQRRVLVRVRVSRPGMEAHIQPRAAAPLRSPSPGDAVADEDVGPGLAIVCALIENHGGHVGVERAGDDGSTVWFWLPAA